MQKLVSKNINFIRTDQKAFEKEELSIDFGRL